MWDKGKFYQMVIITHWSDRTEKVKEIGRKVFYFDADPGDIERYFGREKQVKEIYCKYPEYKRFALSYQCALV